MIMEIPPNELLSSDQLWDFGSYDDFMRVSVKFLQPSMGVRCCDLIDLKQRLSAAQNVLNCSAK